MWLVRIGAVSDLAGLVPAIYAFLFHGEDVDGRDKRVMT